MNETNPLTVIFFGVQGSGKGTQAKLLGEYLSKNSTQKTLHLETGQLLRDFVKESDGYTNRLVDETISGGNLLPSFMPVYVLGRKMVDHFDGSQHLIFDAATRRVNQTVMLDSMLRFYRRTPYHVINITLSEESSIERLLARGRADDTREKIQKRLAWSREHEDAVLAQFGDFDCTVHNIDGEPSIEDIHTDILKTLELV